MTALHALALSVRCSTSASSHKADLANQNHKRLRRPICQQHSYVRRCRLRHVSWRVRAAASAGPNEPNPYAQGRTPSEIDPRLHDDAPWGIGLYHSKRETHRTDEIGEIIRGESGENIMPPPMWTAEARRKLAIGAMAREIEQSEEFVEGRLAELETLLPDLQDKVKFLKIGDLARLAVNVGDVAAAIVRMKTLFPRTNVSVMCSARPTLLLMDVDSLKANRNKLVEMLPDADIDMLVQDFPTMLEDVAGVEKGLAELQVLMPGKDVALALARKPSLLTNVQRHEDIIPYDNGTLIQLQESMRNGGYGW